MVRVVFFMRKGLSYMRRIAGKVVLDRKDGSSMVRRVAVDIALRLIVVVWPYVVAQFYPDCCPLRETERGANCECRDVSGAKIWAQ